MGVGGLEEKGDNKGVKVAMQANFQMKQVFSSHELLDKMTDPHCSFNVAWFIEAHFWIFFANKNTFSSRIEHWNYYCWHRSNKPCSVMFRSCMRYLLFVRLTCQPTYMLK